MSGGLLSFFWDLAGDSDARQSAASGLLAQLTDEQKQYTEIRSEDESTLCANLTYSLKRLVRGLASSRAGARQGFSLALTQVLVTFPEVTTEHLLKLVHKHIASSEGNKQEKRDYCLGRIFATLVLLRSARLGDLSVHQLSKMVALLLTLCENKLPLREICFSTIVRIVEETKFERVEAELWPVLSPLFANDGALLSPEHIALAVTLQRKYKANNLKNPSQTVRRILSSRHFNALTIPLKESARVHPRIHFVWNTLLTQLFTKDKWALLWTTCIDPLFVATAFSHQYLGFQLFNFVLRHLTEHRSEKPVYEVLQPLFTSNFVKCAQHHLQNKKRRLYKCATFTRSVMVECAKKDSKVAFAIVNHLVGAGSGKPFDETVYNQLLSQLDDTGIDSHVKVLNKRFAATLSNVSSDDHKAEDTKAFKDALAQLYAVAKYRPTYSRHLREFLELLLTHGFFQKESEAQVPPAVAKLCGQQLFALLSDLTKPLTRSVKFDEKSDGKKRAPVVWVLEVHGMWKKLLKNGYTLNIDIEEEDEALRKNVLKACKTIAKQGKKKANASRSKQFLSLQVLFPYLALLLLKPEEDIAPILEDLIQCSEALSSKNKKSDNSKHIQVLLDILLSLLSRDSVLLRDLANYVFGAFCSELNKDAIDTVLRALEIQTQTDEEDDEPVFDLIEAAAEPEPTQMQTNQSESSDDDSDSDSGEEEEFKIISNGSNESKEEETIDDFAQLTSLLTDESTEDAQRIATAMAGLVALKQQKKKNQQELLRQTHHFKLRVLDLIETYIKLQGHSSNMLMLVLPLVNGMSGNRGTNKGTAKQQLVNRLQSIIINKLCKSSPDLSPSRVSDVMSLLTTFLERAQKTSKKEVMLVTNRVVVFAIRLLHRMGEKQKSTQGKDKLSPKVRKAMKGAITAFLSVKNSTLNTRFFFDIISRYPVLGWELLPFVCKQISAGKYANGYLLHESWALVTKIISNRALLKSNEEVRTIFIAAIPHLSSAMAKSVKAFGDLPSTSEAAPKWSRFAKYIRTVFKIGCSLQSLVLRAARQATEEEKSTPEVFNSEVKSSVQCLPGPLTELLIPALNNLFRVAKWDIPAEWQQKRSDKKKGKKKATQGTAQQARGAKKGQTQNKRKAASAGDSSKKKGRKNGRERKRIRAQKQKQNHASKKQTEAKTQLNQTKKRKATETPSSPQKSPQTAKKVKKSTTKKKSTKKKSTKKKSTKKSTSS